jgi:hypothetical protein
VASSESVSVGSSIFDILIWNNSARLSHKIKQEPEQPISTHKPYTHKPYTHKPYTHMSGQITPEMGAVLERRLYGGRVFVESGFSSSTFYKVPARLLTRRVRCMLVALLAIRESGRCLEDPWFAVYREFGSLLAVLRAENLCTPLRIGDTDDHETLCANNSNNVFVFHHSLPQIVLDRDSLGLLPGGRDEESDEDSDEDSIEDEPARRGKRSGAHSGREESAAKKPRQ